VCRARMSQLEDKPVVKQKPDARSEKDRWLKFKYNITIEDWEDMLQEQNHQCAICGVHQSQVKRVFHTDHDHETGKVRGLLCADCNHGLGKFKDNVDNLLNAINYLRSTSNE